MNNASVSLGSKECGSWIMRPCRWVAVNEMSKNWSWPVSLSDSVQVHWHSSTNLLIVRSVLTKD